MKNIEVFCDMDGVIVDFIKGANFLTEKSKFGNDWIELIKKNQDIAWKIINEKKDKFWENLEWLHGGKKLWKYIKFYKPIILSAYPYTLEDPEVKINAIFGKKMWIRKELGELTERKSIICSRKDKSIFSGRNKILIDDDIKNVTEWNKRGGVGILYESYEKAIPIIKEII